MMDDLDAAYERLLDSDAMERIFTVLWSEDIGAINVEFEPGARGSARGQNPSRPAGNAL